MNKSAQGYPGELELFTVKHPQIRRDIMDSKVPGSAIKELRRDNAVKIHKQLLAKGIPATFVGGANNIIKLPNNFYELALKADDKGKKTMMEGEELIQRNRARFGGVPYTPGAFYTFPYHVVFPKKTGVVRRWKPVKNSYVVSKDRSFAPKSPWVDNPIQEWIGGAPGYGYLYGYGGLRSADLGTAMHETGHYETTEASGTTGNTGGTIDKDMAINPRFPVADTYHLLYYPTIVSRLVPNKLALHNYKQKIAQYRAKGYSIPNYSDEELMQHILLARPTGKSIFKSRDRSGQSKPISYYNSGKEYITAARSLRKFMETKGIKSVGVRPNLMYGELENGTLPFNEAMTKVGLWRENLHYDPKDPDLSNPRYVPAVVRYPVHYGYDSDVVSNLYHESGELVRHYNRMQYLIDKGDSLSPEERLELDNYQRVLPIIHQLSTSSTGKSSEYYG